MLDPQIQKLTNVYVCCIIHAFYALIDGSIWKEKTSDNEHISNYRDHYISCSVEICSHTTIVCQLLDIRSITKVFLCCWNDRWQIFQAVVGRWWMHKKTTDGTNEHHIQPNFEEACGQVFRRGSEDVRKSPTKTYPAPLVSQLVDGMAHNLATVSILT